MDEDNCCLRCMSMIPVASLLAAAVQMTGLFMFLGVVNSVMAAYSDYFEVGQVNAIFKTVGIVGIVVSALFLILAMLSTGHTREKVCGGKLTNVFGRIITVVDMVICWVLCVLSLLLVVLITGVSMVTTVFYFSCQTLDKLQCLEMRKLNLGSLLHMKEDMDEQLCGKSAIKFCRNSAELWSESVLGIVAAVVMVIGYVIGLQTMSANYVHIKHDMEGSKKVY